MADVTYPYDSSGNAATNLVRDEPQILTQINDDPFRYFIPNFAPFYQNNFVLKARNNLGVYTTLRAGIDYNFCMKYIGATRANGMMVWGGIYIINKEIQGTLLVTYQCLGGAWSANRDYVLQVIEENNFNPRRCAWDQLTNVPDKFPPSGHPEDLDNFTGFRDLIASVDRIANAVATANPLQNAFYQHVLDHNDPHQTLALVGQQYATRAQLNQAIAAHVAAADPHPVYYNLSRLNAYMNNRGL